MLSMMLAVLSIPGQDGTPASESAWIILKKLMIHVEWAVLDFSILFLEIIVLGIG